MPPPDWGKILDFTVEALIALGVSIIGGAIGVALRTWIAQNRVRRLQRFIQDVQGKDKELGKFPLASSSDVNANPSPQSQLSSESFGEFLERSVHVAKQKLSMTQEASSQESHKLITKIDERELAALEFAFRKELESGKWLKRGYVPTSPLEFELLSSKIANSGLSAQKFFLSGALLFLVAYTIFKLVFVG